VVTDRHTQRQTHKPTPVKNIPSFRGKSYYWAALHALRDAMRPIAADVARTLVVSRWGTKLLAMDRDRLVKAFGNISSTSAPPIFTSRCPCLQSEKRYVTDVVTFQAIFNFHSLCNRNCKWTAMCWNRVHRINKYVDLRYCRTEMYTGRVTCCRLVSRVECAPRVLLLLEKRWERQTDGRQTVTLL